MDKQSITKSNSVIEAGYRLSRTEMQIVLYGISLINPLSPEFPRQYRIDIKRFAELFNREHKDIYREVKQAVLRKFWERDFSYKDEQGKTVTNRWLSQVVHHDKKGFLQVKFSEEIQPYLHHLKKNFTTYYIDQIAEFNSVYAIRFYEMAIMKIKKKRQAKCVFKILVKEIKDRLELGEKYSRFYDLNRYVLEAAKRDINRHSDIKLSYKVVKLGRSPHEIEFTVSRKPKLNQAPLTLPAALAVPHDEQDRVPPLVSTVGIEKVKEIAKAAGTGWDPYEIIEQYRQYAADKGRPENPMAALIGFAKKKVEKMP